MNSNVSVRSNVMLDDDEHRPEFRYVPGDLVTSIYPQLSDSRVYHDFLTRKQIVELQQYLTCIRCGRPCAGTCGR